MTLNYVNLTLDLYDGQGNPVTTGTAYFTPSVQLTDAGAELIPQAPIPCVFHSAGLPVVRLLATDSSGPLPGGWGWSVSFSGVPGNPPPFSFFLPFSSGASQFLSSQAPTSSVVTMQAYLPLGGGTMTGPVNMGSQKITSPGGYDPVTSGFACFATGGAANLLNTSSGTSTTMVAGTWYYAPLVVPFDALLTGLMLTAGSVGGTDRWIVALWPYAGGAALANSATAGITAPTANTKGKFAFTSQLPAPGPGSYIAGVQSNGTTAKFLSFINALEGFITGSQAGVFGTIPALTPASTYTTGVGPYANTY